MAISDSDIDLEKKASEALSLILFANMALAGDADKGLRPTGLGRTHHRILFLVAQKPGVTVGEIVTLLRVSTQAIQSPLRALINNKLIKQQSSEEDRRKRHLTLTQAGSDFLQTLSKAQYSRLNKALELKGVKQLDCFLDFLREMMDEADREWLYPSENDYYKLNLQICK